MSLFTSSNFASACASGTDWRDTSKKVLEELESVRGESDYFNFGFIYISDHLAEDMTSIFNLFRSVMKIDDWVGSIGIGVVGCGQAYMDMPCISAMVCRFPENSFFVFPADADQNNEQAASQEAVTAWLEENMPVLTVVHADPMAEEDPQATIRQLGDTTHSFVVGGVTSSRGNYYQIANATINNTVSGVFFSDQVPVSTTVSQGCRPMSGFHTVTKSDDFAILGLDDRPTLDVLTDDLRANAAVELNRDVESFELDLASVENSDQIPPEFQKLFRGQVHVALPLSQSDQNDFLVRNITGVFADEGSLSISERVEVGTRILFVERDDTTMAEDLMQSLISLRKRVLTERGEFHPKAALYVSCIARGFGEDRQDRHEMEIVREVIGDIPLTGFYAGGEINNARLYGYTGVLTLFF